MANAVAVTATNLTHLCADLTAQFDPLRPKGIQPAEGYLKFPYLIPAGYYNQMWDWDGFFMGNHFVSRGQPELLKHWALNLIAGIDAEGYTAGCVNTKGPRPIFGKFAMKPFLSQGAWFAALVRVLQPARRSPPATTTKIPTAASWDSSVGICASKTSSKARRTGSGRRRNCERKEQDHGEEASENRSGYRELVLSFAALTHIAA